LFIDMANQGVPTCGAARDGAVAAPGVLAGSEVRHGHDEAAERHHQARHGQPLGLLSP